APSLTRERTRPEGWSRSPRCERHTTRPTAQTTWRVPRRVPQTAKSLAVLTRTCGEFPVLVRSFRLLSRASLVFRALELGPFVIGEPWHDLRELGFELGERDRYELRQLDLEHGADRLDLGGVDFVTHGVTTGGPFAACR